MSFKSWKTGALGEGGAGAGNGGVQPNIKFVLILSFFLCFFSLLLPLPVSLMILCWILHLFYDSLLSTSFNLSIFLSLVFIRVLGSPLSLVF